MSRDSGGFSQIDMFQQASTPRQHPVNMRQHLPTPALRPGTCETCRSWRASPDDPKWRCCSRRFVVMKRSRAGFAVGDVVTEQEAEDHELAVEYLHTAGHFSCDAWQERIEQVGA